MAVVRWEPFREIATLQSDMGRLMNQLWGAGEAPTGATPDAWIPALDVWETEDAIVLALDMPGVSRDELAIEVDNGRLTISGERARERHEAGERFHRYERRFGTFARSVTLPQGVDEARIAADYHDGVLEIRVPKPEESRPKRIPVGEGVVEAAA